MILVALAIVVVLILVNALYVAAEFSAVSVRVSRIQQKVHEGSWLAERLLPHVQDPRAIDRYVATCQIGITLSSLVLGAYGQVSFSPALVSPLQQTFGMDSAAAFSAAAVLVLVVLTACQMILGELVPKSLALQFPTPVALYTVVPMQVSMRLFSWFIVLLNGSGILILRRLGVPESGHRHIHSPDEIEYLIAESRDGGLLDEDEHERLRKALRLNVTTVDEVMVPRTRIQAVSADLSADEMVRVATKSPYTRLPVYAETLDQVVGYLHVQDVAERLIGRTADLRIRPILFVPESLTLDRLLERMRAERHHIAIVSDEFGGTAGLVTVGDALEEILGGVADELRPPVPDAEALPDGRIRLPGSMRLEEAASWAGAEWDGDSYTLSGYLMEIIGRVPHTGERLSIEGVPVEVEEVSGRMVVSVLVLPSEHEEAIDG